MRIGLVTFNDYPTLQFHLNRHKTKKDIKAAVARIRHHGGIYTFTGEAIKFMRTKCFTPEHGARENVTKIGIVITDGRSYDTQDTAVEANAAREDGIHLFAIGVGKKVDQAELDLIASHPTEEYSFMVENFNVLKNIRNLLVEKTCTGKIGGAVCVSVCVCGVGGIRDRVNG